MLMDMQMPVMDGYTATRLIRLWEAEKRRPRTPIVALTAYALTEDEGKSFEAGCDGHLTKPIKKEHLLEAITRYASRSKARSGPSSAVAKQTMGRRRGIKQQRTG